jgi:hypothetical protein
MTYHFYTFSSHLKLSYEGAFMGDAGNLALLSGAVVHIRRLHVIWSGATFKKK